MSDFRYQATSLTGNVVQGMLSAPNGREARRSVEEICRQRRLRMTALQKRTTFIYKARRGNEKVFRGEQKAFTREEVEKALRKLNYQILSIQKKLFDIRLKPPTKDIVLFARISADLLRERLPYDEILQLLANDTENKTLADTIREIHQDLKEGRDGRAVFGKHTDVLGKFTTYMLSVASTSGNMAEVYESTAKFLERDEEFKKSLKSAMIMPSVIVLALLAAVAYYVGYIFPATAEMFLKFGVDLPPMTRATLQLSNFLRHNALWLFPACLAPVVGVVVVLFRTDRGRLFRDRFMIKIPVIGSLLHKTSIEIFARVFYALYSGSGENINVIRIAAEACRNTYMERQIKEVAIPMMVKEGRGLIESLELAGVFTQNAISRLRSGAESGALRTTALQLANYYERETTYKMKNVVELINILISLLIMVVMTALTLVSSETAVIQPKSPGTR